MAPPSSPSPYLSVVAASRNDDHGGDPLVRTQIFINNFARQCEKYRLPAELILVDWNPVAGRPGLAGVLQMPPEASYCQARVITVPAVLHDRFKYADRMPFFQMIAKNAGIRRARGRFILATNIDIIFSDELMHHLSRQRLDPGKMLRVDRYDIERGLPITHSVEETMDYAWSHPVRHNRRFGPKALVDHLYGDEPYKRHCQPDPEVCRNIKGFDVVQEDGTWSVRPQRDTGIADLHTNACGDFTLLAREGWDAIRGYAEFEAFSFHIDSFGLAAAHYAGFTEVALLPPCVCFHIEHSLGSGWTPEGEKKLFDRLQKNEIMSPEWPVLDPLMQAMRLGEKPCAVNNVSWGLVEFDLPDEPLLPGQMGNTALHPRSYNAPVGQPVSALRLEYDLDRLTVWQERRAYTAAMEQTVGFIHRTEKDREARLESIGAMQRKLEEQGLACHVAESRVRELEQAMEGTQNYLATVEADRTARLHAIQAMQKQLEEQGLARHIAESRVRELEPALKGTQDYLLLVEADRAARLETIFALQKRLDNATIPGNTLPGS